MGRRYGARSLSANIETSLCRLRQRVAPSAKSICNDLVEILEVQSLLLASLALRRAMGTVLYERWSHWLDEPGTT